LAVLGIQATLAYSPLADWIAVPMLRANTEGNAEAIVVLGATTDPYCTPNLPAVRRTIIAARLYRAGRAPLVLFTGGPIGAPPPCTVAGAMASLGEELGIPHDHVLLEERSRNTWTNAVYCAQMLRARQVSTILLVTDSIHMRRAEACFRRQGLSVGRYSVPAIQLYGNNLELLRAVIHERVGYWYYRLKGLIPGGDA
jgi:uncharacterized SAM-binding protein YcdF (DUF218 family)